MINLIYNITAAQNLTNKKVREVRKFYNCCLVIFQKGYGSPRFMSFNDFKKEFVNSRRIRARQYEVSDRGAFAIVDREDGKQHKVRPHNDHLECDCKDWVLQKYAGIKTPTCTHAYAYLNYMGFDSLQEYIKSNQETIQQQKDRLLNRKAVENTMKFIPELNKEIKQYNAEVIHTSTDETPSAFLTLKVNGEKTLYLKVNTEVFYSLSKLSPWTNAETDLREVVVTASKNEYERQLTYCQITTYA